VLVGIVISVLAGLAIIAIATRFYVRLQVNKQRDMYHERVLNRLDKLLRYEHETLGSAIKKKPPPLPPPPEESVSTSVIFFLCYTIRL
jgi:hypothetical protein